MTIVPISFVPQALPLELYAGDGAAMTLALLDAESQPLPLEGEVMAHIRRHRDDSEPLQEFAVTVEDNLATLALTGEQTAELGEFAGSWDVQWTRNGSEPVTIVQGRATCALDVTR